MQGQLFVGWPESGYLGAETEVTGFGPLHSSPYPMRYGRIAMRMPSETQFTADRGFRCKMDVGFLTYLARSTVYQPLTWSLGSTL